MSELENTESTRGASELRNMREELFDQIAALATTTDKTKAGSLIRRFKALDAAVDKAEPEVDASKYGKYKRAREAIINCLDGVGHAMEQEAIVDDLIGNGWRHGKRDADKDVRKALGFHLYNPRGQAVKLLRIANEKIGRYEWPDDMFS